MLFQEAKINFNWKQKTLHIAVKGFVKLVVPPGLEPGTT